VRWLLDEMLPPAVARALDGMGHDARTVREAGLAGAADPEVLDAAVRERRVLVTENVTDFARLLSDRLSTGDPCVPVVFVRRASLSRDAPWSNLASALDRWARANADPYVGPHWLPGG
jgi:predicted nuclease of predicted toxin-antitoxin system